MKLFILFCTALIAVHSACAHAAQADGYGGAIAFHPKARNQSGAQLEAINHGQLRIINGALFDMGSVDTFDPSQFKLTQRDGSQYLLDKHFGIRQIKDPRGNTLDFHESVLTQQNLHRSGR